jgi:hypothetical protein
MTRALVLAVLAAALGSVARAQGPGFIPPRAAVELAIPRETLRRVDDVAFAANDEIVGLDAAVRRAQLALDRELRSPAPDEARARELVEAVSRAEAEVRKNRVVLLIRGRKVLGEELWQRLEAWRAEHAPPPGGPGGGRPPGLPGRPPGPPSGPPGPPPGRN